MVIAGKAQKGVIMKLDLTIISLMRVTFQFMATLTYDSLVYHAV